MFFIYLILGLLFLMILGVVFLSTVERIIFLFILFIVLTYLIL
jgi:hypothetical protein